MNRQETVPVTVRLSPEIAEKLREEANGRYGLLGYIVQTMLEVRYGLANRPREKTGSAYGR